MVSFGWGVAILKQANLALSAAIVIIAFSLFLYLVTHNFRSLVARAFMILLALISLVYGCDVLLYQVSSASSALPWLKAQWVGIALVPAAYLHFSDALLRATNSVSRWRRAIVWAAYFLGVGFLVAVVLSDWVVWDGVYSPVASYLHAGPGFRLFALYFVGAVGGAVWQAVRARQRCLTTASRRRMGYLVASLPAPALGVFPYLLLARTPVVPSPLLLYGVTLAGNLVVAWMVVLMAYAVAFFGILAPDRVVKHSLVHFLLRGPFVASCLLVLMIALPKVETLLGLPRDVVTMFAVVIAAVLLQAFVSVILPFLDRLLYRQDVEEVHWIQQIEQRLLTSTDLQQFLENLLSSLCDLLRVELAFIVTKADGELRLEAYVGNRWRARRFLRHCDLHPVLKQAADRKDEPGMLLLPCEEYWAVPLRSQRRDAVLGLLVVESWFQAPMIPEASWEVMVTLVQRAEMALEDRRLQQRIFSSLRSLLPKIERIQRERGRVRYRGSPTIQPLDDSPIYDPEFVQWVRGALSHYWGGPKLLQSPLLRLRVVEEALEEHGGNAVRALQSVLEQAIERLRPGGERRMTTSEWLIYNILELKFLQGKRVSEVAGRLAMSESDLYRKQRVAIEHVARTLAQMENEAQQRSRVEEEPKEGGKSNTRSRGRRE